MVQLCCGGTEAIGLGDYGGRIDVLAAVGCGGVSCGFQLLFVTAGVRRCFSLRVKVWG